MFKYQHIITTPVFFLFIAFSFMLSVVFYWGRRKNKRIFLSAFNDLVDVIKPDDQHFTNIGGMVGHHANLFINKKKHPFSKVDATITLLPRHSLLYMPISLMIMRFDRLFITLYQKTAFPGEGHLIEKRYAGFRGPKITNAQRLNKMELKWGNYDFLLYFEQNQMRNQCLSFVRKHPDPGTIRHIALVASQRKCFLFMIPRKGQVKEDLTPVYRWLYSLSK
jgi:hypothetical protein